MDFGFKKIILIANSDLIGDINNKIEVDDIVVRFNVPNLDIIKRTGGRTNFLIIANTVNLMEKNIKKGSLFQKVINTLDQKTNIFFAYSDELIKKINPYYTKRRFSFLKKFKIKKNNWGNEKYLSYFKKLNFQVDVIDENCYWDIHEKVGSEESLIISTGLLALNFFLNNLEYKDYKICLCGFSFEGWGGHAWSNEKEYVSKLILEGKVKVL